MVDIYIYIYSIYKPSMGIRKYIDIDVYMVLYGYKWFYGRTRVYGLYIYMGGSSSSWGYPNSWLVFVRKNPNLKWMMTGVPLF